MQHHVNAIIYLALLAAFVLVATGHDTAGALLTVVALATLHTVQIVRNARKP